MTADPAGQEYVSHSGLSRWLHASGRGKAALWLPDKKRAAVALLHSVELPHHARKP